MRNFILCFLMLMSTSSLLRAEAITFEATVNSPRISMEEAMQLTLTFTGVSDNLDPVSMPVIDGFTAKYLGPSTSMSVDVINGQSESHSEKSFIYNLFPNKVGHFQIPAISATIDGQTYRTQPIDVEVFQDSSQASMAPGDQNQTTNTADSLKDKILIKVSVDRTSAYLNQRIPLTIKLLVNGVPVRDIQFPQFDKTGFMADEFDKPEQDSEIVNGVKYDTVKFKTNIYPDHPGDLAIGPVQIQGNVIYKSSQNNPFGADIFNNFFDSYVTRPMTVTSQPFSIRVLPLPEDNRPQDFSGAIGQFDFQASVSPLQVKAGDPLTLKMSINGSGNFKSFKMPVFEAEGFKTYAPTIKDTGDEKTAEEVIIPTVTTVKEVPALHFSYFDTSANAYKTVTQGPFPVQVTVPSPDQDFKAVGFSDVSRESSMPSSQFSLGKVFDNFYKILRKLSGSIWFWLSLGLIITAGVTYFLWRGFQDRLENDPAFARRLKAVREARQALEPAEGYIATGKHKDFYALISKVLRDYLANKWHQSSAVLSVEEIAGKLRSIKADEALITQVRNLLEKSDLVCFAGAVFDSNKMQADLSQTRDLIAHLEKSLK